MLLLLMILISLIDLFQIAHGIGNHNFSFVDLNMNTDICYREYYIFTNEENNSSIYTKYYFDVYQKNKYKIRS